MSLGHFTRDSADTVNLRGSDLPVGSANWPELQGNDLLSPQRASSFTASFESPNHTGTCVKCMSATLMDVSTRDRRFIRARK